MKHYPNILFDLDGTLSDSSQGITKSVEYALNYFEIKVRDRKELEVFIGPSLEQGFMEFYGFTKEKAIQAKYKTREYFSTKGIWKNELYPFVTEMLKELKSRNKKIILATSKPSEYAKKILEQHHILTYFDFVSGATLDGIRESKEDVIQYALDSLNITNPEECLMIGDRKYDIQGAKKFKIDSVGVLYGFGSEQEIQEAGATYIVKEVKQILEVV